MTPQFERLTVLCKQLNLLHLPTQIAHLGQMAAKRELGYLDFLEQALKDEAMARAERELTSIVVYDQFDGGRFQAASFC